MSTQPLTAAKFREFDSNGNPLAGGQLWTYAAGTTTLQATYTTRAGDVANANPVVLDASGRADVWLAPGVDYKFVLTDAQGNLQYTEDNFPSTAGQSASTDDASLDPGGRLTLTAGTPVTTADVTGATTLYYVPYRSTKVPLFDGANWALFDVGSAGISQTTGDNTKSPAAVAANNHYDVFVWLDSGTLRLSRGPAWPSARGTGAGTSEVQQVNGRWVNANSISNGPAAQRGLYVGTVFADVSAQLNDSAALRTVWNTYNRKQRSVALPYAANGWSYSSNVWRLADGLTSHVVQILCGLSEDAVALHVSNRVLSSTATLREAAVGVGVNSTTPPTTAGAVCGAAVSSASSAVLRASYFGVLGIGRNTISALERGDGAGDTQTFAGYSSGLEQHGLFGEVWA